MIQNYSLNPFTPTENTISVIKQFARTFRPLLVDGKHIPFYIN